MDVVRRRRNKQKPVLIHDFKLNPIKNVLKIPKLCFKDINNVDPMQSDEEN